MKWYKYPLAIVAYALAGVFLLAYAYFEIAKKPLPDYWLIFPAIAGGFLVVSFVLSRMKLDWQLDVVLQVVFVLAPVVWYVNQREVFKRPVYVFVVNPVYAGKMEVIFSHDKNAKTNARSTADTLYFKFDERGKIVLNEDAEYIRASIRAHMMVIHADGKRTRVPFVSLDSLPADTLKKVLVEDTMVTEKGRVKYLQYRLDYPQRLR